MAIYDNRICKQCGTTFSGGAHAFYCDICRVERSKELDRARKQRSRNGTARKTGSKDICALCGKSYIVENGMQKYCSDCKEDAIKTVDRESGLKYYNENRVVINYKKRESRKYERRCKVCGNDFLSKDRSECCSDECRKIAKNELQRAIYDKRKK